MCSYTGGMATAQDELYAYIPADERYIDFVYQRKRIQ